MQLIVLYGPPGVGKLTAGTELEALTGARLLHNHLTVNLANALFPFRSQPWRALLRQLRDDIWHAAAAERVSLIVTTVFNGSESQIGDWTRLATIYREAGATVTYVRLVCDRSVLFARMQQESRLAHGKLTQPQRFVDEVGDNLFPLAPFDPTLTIDSTALTPGQTAAEILTRLPAK